MKNHSVHRASVECILLLQNFSAASSMRHAMHGLYSRGNSRPIDPEPYEVADRTQHRERTLPQSYPSRRLKGFGERVERPSFPHHTHRAPALTSFGGVGVPVQGSICTPVSSAWPLFQLSKQAKFIMTARLKSFKEEHPLGTK